MSIFIIDNNFIVNVAVVLHTTSGLGDVAAFENRQPVTAAKFINKSSLSIQLLGVIRRLELKPISEQKIDKIFVAPPYCQTACCLLAFVMKKNPFLLRCQKIFLVRH